MSFGQSGGASSGAGTGVGSTGGSAGGLSSILGMLGGATGGGGADSGSSADGGDTGAADAAAFLKELGALSKGIGGAIDAGNKLSPRTKQMLTQAVQSQQQQQQKREISPFVGDMMQFITPDIATKTLSELGIPSRRAML